MTKTQKVQTKILDRIADKQKAIQAYISEGDIIRLNEIARKDDRSVSAVIRRAISEYLENHGD